MAVELNQPVILTYTSGSPTFISKRRFVYTIVGIHRYSSPKTKTDCERHVLFPSLANNEYCELDTISCVSCVLKIARETSSCPIPPVFVVDASALTKGDDGYWNYKYR